MARTLVLLRAAEKEGIGRQEKTVGGNGMDASWRL